MEELKGFLAWAAVGAAGVVIKAGIAPILLIALASGVLNQLGKRLGDPLADYIEAKVKHEGIRFFTKFLRKKKPKI